jgi:O-antigen/teichoic acid export membrane protein
MATLLLAPAQFGALALLMAFHLFCGLVLVSPLNQHLNRHTHQWWDDGTLRARLRGFATWIVAIASIGGAVTFGWMVTLENEPPGPAVLSGLTVSAYVFFATWGNTFIPLLNMVGLRGASVIWGMVATTAGLAAALLLSMLWPTATAWLIGQSLGLAIAVIGARHALWGRAPAPGQPGASVPFMTAGTFYAFCVPLAVATVFMWFQTSGYRLLVGQFWGLAALGHVSVGLALAGMLWGFAETLAINFLYPYFYRRVSGQQSEDRSAFSDLVNVLGPVYLLLAGAILLAAYSLLRLFVDPQYAVAGIFVALGAVIDWTRATTNLFGNAAQVTRVTRTVIMPWSAGAFLFQAARSRSH